MNTQHLETETDLEAEARQRVLDAARAEFVLTHEAPTSSRVKEAEIDGLLYKLQAKNHRGGLRRLFCSQRTPIAELDQWKQMPLDSVLAILREESQKRAVRQKRFLWIFLSVIVVMVVASIWTRNMHLLNQLGSYTGLLSLGAAASLQHKSAAVTLSRFNDVRAIGPFAEALEFKDKDVAATAATKLIELLPLMKASDAHLLSPEQRTCLNRALRGKNTDLILAILKAYEQVGDTGAISEVEKLATGRGYGGRSLDVVTAARECLPALRQSAERQQVGSQLLRASDAGPVSPDTLLRPAMPHASSDPQDQLLRPTDIIG